MKIRILILIPIVVVFPIPGHAQWVQTNGPYGCYASSLIVKEPYLFASGTPLGYVAALSNADKKWRAADSGLNTNFQVMAFAVIGPNLLAGTDNGIFLSTDNGENWPETDNNVIAQSFAVSDNIVFAGTGDGVFRSSDSGQTWTQINSGLTEPDISAVAANNGIVYAGTRPGLVFHSTNEGTNWIEQTVGPGGTVLTSLATNGSDIFAGTDSGVYASTDSGSNWIQSSTGLPSTTIRTLNVSGSNLFAGTDKGVYLSTDNGRSWIAINNGLSNTQVQGFTTAESSLFVATTGGVFLSVDTGKNWVEIDSGLTYALQTNFLLSDDTNILAGTPNGVYLSTNNGANWSSINSQLTDIAITALAIIKNHGQSMLFAGTNSGPFLSTNYGASWSPVDSGFPSYSSSYLSVNSFAVIDTMLFAATQFDYGGLYRSTNYGMSWENVDTTDTTGFTTLCASGDVFVAGALVNTNFQGGVLISSDEGNSWNSDGFPDLGQDAITSIAIDTDANGDINVYAQSGYAQVGGGIFLTRNLGVTWTSFNSSLGDVSPFVTSLVACDTFMLAGSESGIYFTTINGSSWTVFNDGLTDSDVYSIAATGTNLFAGTGSGVWRRPISEMIETNGVSNPQTSSLQIQSYPNPFSRSTTIAFSSPESGAADVSVVNILGAEVARIFSGQLDAGEHSFTWDASALPPGMYECIIRMNGNIQRIPLSHLG